MTKLQEIVEYCDVLLEAAQLSAPAQKVVRRMRDRAREVDVTVAELKAINDTYLNTIAWFDATLKEEERRND